MNDLVERAGIFLALLDLELEVEALRVAVESGESLKIRETANRLVMMVAANGYGRLEQYSPYLLDRIGLRVLEANCRLINSRMHSN